MKQIGPVLVFVLLCSAAAAAQEWTPIDGRTRSLGGAGVADTEGAGAGYLNPSGLAEGAEGLELLTGFGISASGFLDIGLEGDILGVVDTINDLYRELGGGAGFTQVQTDLNGGTANDQDLRDAVTLINAVSRLGEEGLGVVAGFGGGLDLRLGTFGVFDNIASDESHPVYTAGLGLNLLGLSVDINAQIASKRTEVEAGFATTSSVRIPERLSIAASLGFEISF